MAPSPETTGGVRRPKWTREGLRKPVSAVRHDRVSLRAASKTYNVPVRTLRDHLRAQLRDKPGRPPVLTEDEEVTLAARLKRLAKIGYGLTSHEIRSLVFQYCEKHGTPNPFTGGQAGRKWFRGFMKRTPELSVRQAEKLNFARGMKMNRTVVNNYIDLLEKTMRDNSVLHKPESVFNADESGVQLTVGKSPQVVACKGDKRVFQQVPAEKAETVSIMVAGNAIGTYIPPYVVYKGARKQPHYGHFLPSGSDVAISDTGYFNSSIFLDWLDHFQRFRPAGPVLLIVDGHRSHVSEEVADKVEELGIELMCLPSNTTHELQPMDKSFFGPFKRYFDEEVSSFIRLNPGKAITKGPTFEKVFRSAYSRAAKSSTLVNGFRATGMFPPTITNIQDDAFAAAEVSERPGNDDTADGIFDDAEMEETADGGGRQGAAAAATGEGDGREVPAAGSSRTCSPAARVSEPDLDVSFVEMLPTPKHKRSAKPRRKSVNAEAVRVKKVLFDQKKTAGKKDKTCKKSQKEDKKSQKDKGSNKSQKGAGEAHLLPSTSDDVICLYCGMRFRLSCETWIRCEECQGWACVPCTDAEKQQRNWMCDHCREE